MSKLKFIDPVGSAIGKGFGGGKEGYISAFLDPGNFRDKVSGKSEKDAGELKAQSAKDAAELIRIQSEIARGDANRLFAGAQQAGQGGFQSALDVFNQSVPTQQQAFQGGNVAAQNQILAGLPQIQNALFGNQVDLSQLQAYNPQQQDMSFLNQQLPFTQQQNEQQNEQVNMGIMGQANNNFNPFQSPQSSIHNALNQRIQPINNQGFNLGNTAQRLR